MFTTQINGGHASAAEQKIKVLKQKLTAYYQNSEKSLQKKSKFLILKQVTENINHIPTEKYGISPNGLLSNLEKNPYHNVPAWNIKRMEIVNKAYLRRERMFEKNIGKRKEALRDLEINDLVLIPAGRLRKSDYPSRLDKVTTNKEPYFKRNFIFKVTQILRNSDNRDLLYRLQPLTNIPDLKRKLELERFTRDELYALKNNTISSTKLVNRRKEGKQQDSNVKE